MITQHGPRNTSYQRLRQQQLQEDSVNGAQQQFHQPWALQEHSVALQLAVTAPGAAAGMVGVTAAAAAAAAGSTAGTLMMPTNGIFS